VFPVRPVVPLASLEQIVLRAAFEAIVGTAAEHGVVAVFAVERVAIIVTPRPRASEQDVVTHLAPHRVEPDVADRGIVACSSKDAVISRTAVHEIMILAQRGKIWSSQGVVALAPVNRIPASVAEDSVGPLITLQDIGRPAAFQVLDAHQGVVAAVRIV
jgi:hypothetical protein